MITVTDTRVDTNRPLATWTDRLLALFCLTTLVAAPLQAQQNPIELSLSVDRNAVQEGSGTSVQLTLTASEGLNRGESFPFSLTGTGVTDNDFDDLANSIFIGGEDTTGSTTLAIVDDNLIEGTETVVAMLGQQLPPGFVLAPNHSASFNLQDNETASVTFVSAESTHNENAAAQMIGIKIEYGSAVLATDINLNLAFNAQNTAVGEFSNAGTPTQPNADLRVNPSSITFTPNNRSGSIIEVEALTFGDSRIEGEEAARLDLQVTGTGATVNQGASHNIKIVDQNRPNVTFAQGATNIAEGNSANIGLVLNLGNDTLETTLEFNIVPQANNDAIGRFPNDPPLNPVPGPNDPNAVDYEVTALPIIFASGSPDGSTRTFSAAANTENLVEGEETANVKLELVTSGIPQFVQPPAHTLRIQDANTARIQFQTASTNVAEGDGPLQINLVLDTDGDVLTRQINVEVANRSIGQAIGSFAPPAPGDQTAFDFDFMQQQTAFPALTPHNTVRSLQISSRTDNLVEGPEFATLGIDIMSGPGVPSNPSTHTYNIADGNRATFEFVGTQSIVNEGVNNHGIEIVLNTTGATLATPISVALTNGANDTATGDIPAPGNDAAAAQVANDYRIPSPEVTFPTGSTDNTRKMFLANTFTDQLLEGEEIGNLSFDQINGPGAPGENDSFALKIQDLNGGSLTWQTGQSTVAENITGNHSITTIIDTGGGTIQRPLTVTASIGGGTASSGTDFNPLVSTQVVFPANSGDNATQSFQLPILDDMILEPSETVELTLHPTTAPFSLSTPSVHTVSITDDDQALLQLQPVSLNASEPNTGAVLRLNFTKASSTETAVVFKTTDNQNPNGVTRTITVPAGRTEFLVQTTVNDDNIVEGPENFTVELDSISSGDPELTIDPNNRELMLVLQDDDMADITLSVNRHAAEDAQNGILQITTTKPIDANLTFDLMLAGTATSGVDYQQPLAQLTLSRLATAVQLDINVIADNLAEGNETIAATIAAVNLPELPISLVTTSVTMNLTDDDAAPVANNDGLLEIDEDQTLSVVSASGVLANDTDADDGNGPANLTASLSGPPPANAQSFSLNPDGSFEYQPNPNFNGQVSFQYVASDGTNNSPPGTVTIQVQPINDPPSITAPGAQTVREGNTLRFEGEQQTGITFGDVDAGLAPLEVTLTATGTMTLGNTNDLNFTQGDGQDDSTMTFTGDVPLLNGALDGLVYTPPARTLADTIQIAINDRGNTGGGGAQTTQGSIAINIIPINTAPVLQLPVAGTIIVTGSGTAQTVASNLIVQDAESPNLDHARVSITGNFNSGQDQLSLSPIPAGLQSQFDSNTGVLQIQGPAPVATFQQALRAVQFANTSTNPNTDPRQVSFTVNDGLLSSNTITQGINVVSPEFPPFLSATGTSNAIFQENGNPVSLLRNVSLSQGSAGPIQSAIITIESGFVPGQDTLRGSGSGLTSTFDSTNGRLELSGNAGIDIYETALGTVVFSSLGDSPSPGTRTISFSVSDSERSSNTVRAQVGVQPSNDAPALSLGDNPDKMFASGDSPLPLLSDVSISDPDDTQLGAASVLFSSGFQSGIDILELPAPLPSGISGASFDSTNGSLTISGNAPFSAYVQALTAVRYRNDSEFTQDRSLRVLFGVADPSGATSSTQSLGLDLVGQSTPPVFEGLDDFKLPEDTKEHTLQFTVSDDRTPLEQIEIEFTAPETDLFAEDGVQLMRDGGALSLSLFPLPNLSGDVTFNFTARDAQGLSTQGIVQLTIEGINDPPKVEVFPLTPLEFFDGSGPRSLFDEVTIMDIDNKTLFGATLMFTQGFVPGEDELQVISISNPASRFDPSTGTLEFQGEATPDEYARALQNVVYMNPNHRPTESIRLVRLMVQDLPDPMAPDTPENAPEDAPKPIDLQIKVMDQNLAPIGDVDRINANGQSTASVSHETLLANDSDPDADSLTITLVTARSKNGARLSSGNGQVTVTGLDPLEPDHFFYTVSDGNGAYTTVRVDITP